jgi:hypothetical protein
VTANSPAAFYAIEFGKAAAPSAAIALIFVATFSLRHIVAGSRLVALQIITALWCVATLLSRVAWSSPVHHHFLSGHIATEEEHRAMMDSFFAVTSALYAFEQALFFAFAVALFLVLRGVRLQPKNI